MTTHRQYLLKPDKHDNRDYMFASRTGQFLESIDLRLNDFPEIFNQGYLGSCSAFAMTSWLMYHTKHTSPSHYYFYLSQLYLYYKTREIQGTVNFDSGGTFRDGLKVLKNIGCCTQSYFPYNESTYKNKPTIEAEVNAKEHRINEYHRIMTVAQFKEALSDGKPVMMGIEIFQSFESDEVAKTGIVPFPDRNKEYSLGFHAVLGMGYLVINGEEHIICRNSWGKEWGDNGYFYLPMKFIGYFVSDMWVAK